MFKTKVYSKDLKACIQTIQQSGVGDHHQNSAADQNIRTVSESARSTLIHAALHWPEHTDTNLCPFAIDYEIYVFNKFPNSSLHLSQLEIFSGSKVDKPW